MTTGAPTQNMPKGPLFLRYATGFSKDAQPEKTLSRVDNVVYPMAK